LARDPATPARLAALRARLVAAAAGNTAGLRRELEQIYRQSRV
jgi:hypothetical protein